MCSTHDGRAECYACSDTQPWYAGVRHQDALLCDCKVSQKQAFYNEVISAGSFFVIHPEVRCIDCGNVVVKGPRCKSCGLKWYHAHGPKTDRQAGVPLRERYARRYAGRP